MKKGKNAPLEEDGGPTKGKGLNSGYGTEGKKGKKKKYHSGSRHQKGGQCTASRNRKSAQEGGRDPVTEATKELCQGGESGKEISRERK